MWIFLIVIVMGSLGFLFCWLHYTISRSQIESQIIREHLREQVALQREILINLSSINDKLSKKD